MVKTTERALTPSKTWKATKLSDNYDQAISQIDDQLEFWNGFIIHKCKQRLTKLTEMLTRKRRMKVKGGLLLRTVKKKAERRDRVRMEKAETVAKVDSLIEKELLDRLKLGTYGELYDDLYNLNRNAMDEFLKENELPDEEEEFSEQSLELEVN